MKKQKTEKLNTNKGITLIALVITIIVMLILVAVTISMAVNGGLFDYAGKAIGETQNEIDKEQQLADGKIQVDGKWYESIYDYIAGEEIKQPYLGLTVTTETDGVVYTDKDGNRKELTEEVEDGDIILYGDYEYRYNSKYEEWFDDTSVEMVYNWLDNPEQNGWGVKAKEKTKSKYGELCGTILGKQVKVMEYTFVNCDTLTESPQIPESVTNMNKTFWGCEALKEAPEIPNGVTDMTATYEYCTDLTNGSISDSVTILDRTFRYCSNLVSVCIPDNVTVLRETFRFCHALVNIELPNSIEEIGYDTFGNCESLLDITIPINVKTIGSSAFYGCVGLTSITIPNGVETIGYFAFCDCDNLTKVTLPDTLRSIDRYAFQTCVSLKSIFIPISVEAIGKELFKECESDLVIYCEADSAQSGWNENWNYYETNLKHTSKYGYTREQYEAETSNL